MNDQKQESGAIRKRWTMSRGAIYDRGRVYILGSSEGESGTRVFRWTGKWDNYYVPFLTAGIGAVFSNPPEIVTVGADGSAHIAGPGGFSTEHADQGKEGPQHRGVIRAAHVIDGRVFIAGMGRQIYQRKSRGVWTRFDEGVLDPRGSDKICGFESIDGFSLSEVYAVGLNGEIGVCQRNVWKLEESPTNLILEKVVCAPNGVVYAVGQVGTIIKGRAGQWAIVQQDLTTDNFWDAAWHEGQLWLSTTKELFCLDPSTDTVAKINIEEFTKQSCGYLDARDGVLWSFGAENLAYREGAQWRIVGLP